MNEVAPRKGTGEEDSDTRQQLPTDTSKVQHDPGKEHQQEESEHSGDLASSLMTTTTTTTEESNIDNSETTDQTDDTSSGSPEDDETVLIKGSPLHEDSTTTPQAKDSNDDGDHNKELSATLQPTIKPEIPLRNLTGQKKETETTGLTSLGDEVNDQGDQPKVSLVQESSAVGAGGEESNIDNSETTDQTDDTSSGSPEDDETVLIKGSPLHEDSTTTPQAKDSNDDGDHNKELSATLQPTIKPEIPLSNLTGQKKETETTGLTSLGDEANDQGDQPKVSLVQESSAVGAGGDNGRSPEPDSSAKKDPEEEEENEEEHVQRQDVENIGPIIQEAAESTFTVVTRFLREHVIFLIPVVLAIVVAVFLMTPHQPESPPQINNVDILLRQMDKVKTWFPHQRAELWKRSKIHLKRHLQTAQPTAPVNLILTAGLRGERTLHCLAQSLASAFSFAVNASVLHIDGAGTSSQDSDQVKLDIDSKLQGAFEGDKPVAVIHRFEELPPGSTLIFYRYCDHENAAYKGTVLIFTVLLEEEEIPGKIPLNFVEEMVDDHLKKKFLSHSRPVSFDRMDLDKYGGLWSRISHLILPVAAEERIEYEGCWGT